MANETVMALMSHTRETGFGNIVPAAGTKRPKSGPSQAQVRPKLASGEDRNRKVKTLDQRATVTKSASPPRNPIR